MATEEQLQLFQAWKQDPVTQRLFEALLSRREDLKEAWANGHMTAAFETEMMAKNAAATGACSILQELLNLTVGDLYEE